MQQARFQTLDALRGVAAIAVMLFHAKAQSPILMPSGYLAADLFFVLSGFVLANAYEGRLRAGMPLKTFVQARLLRIYPVYWLGALTGCVLWGGSALILLMIPTPSPNGLLFEANAPMWSLLFELVANIAWACVAARLDMRGLAAVLVALGGGLLWFIVDNGSVGLGPFWPTALPGLIRTCFSFAVGVLLWRLFKRRAAARRETALGWLLLPALVGLMACDPASRLLFDLAMVGLGLPLIVWLGAHWEVRSSRLAARLGGLSFPLYCLHLPFIAFAHNSNAAMAVVCAAMVALALAVDRWFDRPIQAWLKVRLKDARQSDRSAPQPVV